MGVYLFFIIIIIFAIIGFVDICSFIEKKIFEIENKTKAIIVLPLSSSELSPEINIRNAICKIKWGIDKSCYKIVIVDLGLNNDDKQICDLLIKQYSNIKICPQNYKEDLINLINRA
jgi:hypothetical protein